jgi:hypothetical protein
LRSEATKNPVLGRWALFYARSETLRQAEDRFFAFAPLGLRMTIHQLRLDRALLSQERDAGQ